MFLIGYLCALRVISSNESSTMNMLGSENILKFDGEFSDLQMDWIGWKI
jgi:hypothetical protein